MRTRAKEEVERPLNGVHSYLGPISNLSNVSNMLSLRHDDQLAMLAMLAMRAMRANADLFHTHSVWVYTMLGESRE